MTYNMKTVCYYKKMKDVTPEFYNYLVFKYQPGSELPDYVEAIFNTINKMKIGFVSMYHVDSAVGKKGIFREFFDEGYLAEIEPTEKTN